MQAPETPPTSQRRRLRKIRSVSPSPCGRPSPRESAPVTPPAKPKRASSLTSTPEKKRKVTEESGSPPACKKSVQKASVTPIKRKGHRAPPEPYKDPAGLDPSELAIEGTVRRQVEKIQDLMEAAFKAGDVPEGFRIGTACSGTDAPILAMVLANEALAELRREEGKPEDASPLKYKHVMSCEIEPFKQAFLARNFKDATIFPDLTKLVPEDGSNVVQTVFGGEAEVPSCEMFVTGTVCKDFSMRRTHRLDLEDKGKSGNTFYSAVDYIWKHKPMFTIFENVLNAPWDKMAEFITGRVLVETIGKGKESGAKVITSKKTKTDDVADLLFKVLPKGQLQVIEVPRKAGVKQGQKLIAIEPAKGKKRSVTYNAKPGSEVTFEKLKKVLKIAGSDILIFEAAKHGYRAHYIKVDTACFELPHTRNRGYMLVWRKDVGGQEIGKHWAELVKGLESPVQYSLQHYLLPDDDERVRRVRENLRGPLGRAASEENAKAWAGDWWSSDSKDVQRQVRFRKDNHFDATHRPMTGWGKHGLRRAQPQLWPELMGVIDSRMCDLMDGFAMECAAEDPPRDVNHSNYVWDISQNIDMTSSYNKPGVCGCLTPGGWLLFPDQGRCMLGFEKLIVNGIPADRMLLGSETEVQLSDLAGNAMSLPVVLACMLSAVSVKEYARRCKKDPKYDYDFGHKAIEVRKQKQRQQVPRPMQVHQPEAAPALPMFQLLAKMADVAEATSILCKCETSGSISEHDILHCTGCGLSICRHCGQQAALASHSLELRLLAETRSDEPAKFTRQLRQNAPQKLLFKDEVLGKYEYVLVKVLRGEGRWTLRYLSHDGVDPSAELCIHVGQLAIGAKEKGLRCVLRTLNTKGGKSDVTARLVLPAGKTKAQWEVQHSPVEKEIQLRGSQPGPSFRSEMTVEEYLPERWPDVIKIQNGEYHRLPCRGTIAQGGLWRSTDASSFLYLNPNKDRTGDDTWQFASSPSYKDADTFASGVLTSDWVPKDALTTPERKVKVSVPVWKAVTKLELEALKDGIIVNHCRISRKAAIQAGADMTNLLTTMDKQDEVIEFVMDGQKVPFRELTEGSPKKKAKKTIASLHQAQHTERSLALIPICGVSGIQQQAVQRLLIAAKSGSTVEWVDLRVAGAGSAQTIRRFSDAVGAPLLRESFSADFKNWIKLPALKDTPWGTDRKCVPKPPPETWIEKQRNYDPQESQEFEREMQTRPEVWKPRMTTCGMVEVRVCPEAAAHRAAAAISHGNKEDMTCSWRLMEPSTALESTPGAFKVPTSDKYPEAPTPKLFKDEYKLYERQARALSRMQSLEAGEVNFCQQERSEHELPGVGWIFEAKAEVGCKIPGGVLADEMGAGKTVTTIALVAADKELRKIKSHAKTSTSNATLIMAPPTLILQWDEERKKFTGDNLKTILLPDASALKAVTAQELLDADMVIASFELLAESAYMKNLRAKAGYDGLPESIPSGSGQKEPDRLTGIWIPGHPANVYGSSKGKQVQREEMAYFASEYAKTIEELRKKKLSPDLTNPPLEYFQWHRIVVDEVHQALTVEAREKPEQRAAREMLGVSQSNSHLRPLRAIRGIWGLTGTPMLSNEARVTEMASLMGGVYIMGAQQHWRGMERASLRDQFLKAQEPEPSTHYRAQSRAHAQSYVSASFQRNRVEQKNLPNCVVITENAQLKPKAADAYRKCLAEAEIDTNNFSPDLDAIPEVIRQKLLDHVAATEERGQALQQIIKKIHKAKGDHVKVTVFAADGCAASAAREAMNDAGLKFTAFKDKDFRAFAHADLTDADRALPRIALLTFDQAAGLNLQHSCSHVVLFAPLYTGTDPVPSCAKEQQAIGRVLRDGQKQEVFVYRIILKGPRGQNTVDTQVLIRNTKESTIQAVTCD